ncbi:PhzF family phenazine biosynthesis protein [Kribbella jejuensis]|uniref:PhzF family phenazine biosynthesis protein n=1 Tax=Kribbella jejuensis TaxID=236068 RepID=A0A542DUM6_9ACTN|nr:PhzF family phenazine biosynthesis isomerase [Kribbella jejuensis]TQJ06716.1 PhzF family phenazine biosynthesis protein [Kribbella jejuensis]
MSLEVTVVQACRRSGRGGSRTAVVTDTELRDSTRRAIPAAVGASHAVFISTQDPAAVRLRFFTSTGELPACGHGTVAALAVLAQDAGEYEGMLQTAAGLLPGHAIGREGEYSAAFTPGPIELHAAAAEVADPILSALGVGTETVACHVASVGRPRLLVELADQQTLTNLAPDMPRLRAATDRLGLLGCYAYVSPSADGRTVARMFAPSIGVPEDIANANSTACLAAYLSTRGHSRLQVDMGDSLGHPATMITTVTATSGPPIVEVGGQVAICVSAERVEEPIDSGR